ncbi:unnamed protein product [Candidula unifasciata]|uniref:Pleckstrin homology domain-containing family A member 8 n=1 Tax=Candidula unifasciata TaxID=100452 RepID=A0A8S3ZV16_9EUPU|nr:unnamed protein product [Candidula unifasciata]
MEGVLLKWTNYLSGWQPRWFILDNGVLSYYKSQEDVNNGCKGSIKMAVCDIVVHPTDMTRLDLIIPGEQHYYVKAGTPQDRQSWLIALGSSKASFSEASAAKKEADAVPDLMRTKKSELRLYCDLLMQQVHSIKQTVSTSDGKLDVEKLTESTSLVVVTCDTFIATLDECMKLVSNTPMFESPHQHVRDAAIPTSPTRANVQRLPGTRSVITRPVENRSSKHRTVSVSSTDSMKIHTQSSPFPSLSISSTSKTSLSPTLHSPNPSHPPSGHMVPHFPSVSPVRSDSATPSPELPGRTPSRSPSDPSVKHGVNGIADPTGSSSSSLKTAHEQISSHAPSSATSSEDLENLDDFKDAIDENILTFFSSMPKSFAHVDTSQEDQILVVPFLDACRHLVPIFDKLNSTAFAPVKMDFCGNIKKIHQKYESNPSKFTTLQSMVLTEVEGNQHTNSSSATCALLWLKRSLEFIREFLRECNSGSTDMSVCASNAYSRTLKLYHGWVVRGVFAMAIKSLPYRETFLSHLAAGSTEIDTTSSQFEHVLLTDIENFVFHLNRVLTVLSDFYIKHSLDSLDTV